MRPDVIYDRDLSRARRWVILLAIGNAILAGLNAYEGNWVFAITAGLWVLACCLWRGILTAQQRTRDMGRSIEAGLHGVYRDMETGEFL